MPLARFVRPLLLFVAVCAVPLRAETAQRVTSGTLRVRVSPGAKSRVMGTIRRDQNYVALRRRGDWLELQYDRRRGWAHTRHLVPSGALTARVARDDLAVRSGAGTRFRVLARLPRDSYVAVQGRVRGWRKISFRGRQAWVFGEHLAGGERLHRVTATRLNVRAKPSPSARRLGILGKGARVRVRRTRGTWSQIAYDGGLAWVARAHLERLPLRARRERPRSRSGFVQLAASGPGFYCYDGASGRWGAPRTIYAIERVGRRWQGKRPRMGVGDISLANGGPMPGHATHQRGLDIDVRPVRNDGREARSTIYESTYSRRLTQQLIDLFYAEARLTQVLFLDTRVRRTRPVVNHHHHFHVSLR